MRRPGPVIRPDSAFVQSQDFKTPAQTCEETAAGGGIHSLSDPARLRQRAPL